MIRFFVLHKKHLVAIGVVLAVVVLGLLVYLLYPRGPMCDVNVPYSVDEVQQLQTQVDQGHQPWRLSPIEVAKSWAKEQGDQATGEPAVIKEQGGKAIIKMGDDSKYEYVFLRQLVKTGPDGIWTVTGYTERQ